MGHEPPLYPRACLSQSGQKCIFELSPDDSPSATHRSLIDKCTGKVRTQSRQSEAPMNADAQQVPRLVNTREAAEILGRSPATLKRWRYEGVGPAYVEIEGRVSYDVAVLIEYINVNTRVPSVRAYMEDSREAL